jgi:hypothetical protein
MIIRLLRLEKAKNWNVDQERVASAVPAWRSLVVDRAYPTGLEGITSAIRVFSALAVTAVARPYRGLFHQDVSASLGSLSDMPLPKMKAHPL